MTPTWFQTKQNLPPRAQAASLVAAILRKTKTESWGDGAASGESWPEPAVRLTVAQRGLIDAHRGIVDVVRYGADGVLTVAVCDTCPGWLLMGPGQVPARCTLTRRCAGQFVKAVVATSWRPPSGMK